MRIMISYTLDADAERLAALEEGRLPMATETVILDAGPDCFLSWEQKGGSLLLLSGSKVDMSIAPIRRFTVEVVK